MHAWPTAHLGQPLANRFARVHSAFPVNPHVTASTSPVGTPVDRAKDASAVEVVAGVQAPVYTAADCKRWFTAH